MFDNLYIIYRHNRYLEYFRCIFQTSYSDVGWPMSAIRQQIITYTAGQKFQMVLMESNEYNESLDSISILPWMVEHFLQLEMSSCMWINICIKIWSLNRIKISDVFGDEVNLKWKNASPFANQKELIIFFDSSKVHPTILQSPKW